MKKQLLNESDIRKMMKFANIGALSDGFVERLNETYMEGHDDDHMEEGMHEDETEEGMHAEGMHEDEMEETMYEAEHEDEEGEPEMDMGDDLPVPDDMGMDAEGGVLGHVSAAVEALKAALEAAGPAGKEAAAAITVQDEGGDEPPADLGMDAEAPMDDAPMGMDDEAADDLPGEDEEPLAEMIDEDEVMNEVARRVAKRLLRMKRNN